MAAPAWMADAASRTRVMQGASEGCPWEMWLRTPFPELNGLVLGLWAGMAARAGERHRTLPNGEVVLMFHLSAPQHLSECDGAPIDPVVLRSGFVAGIQERPATFECIEASTRVATVRLSPLGAWRILGGLPQGELLHRVVEIDAVLAAGSGVRELGERMRAARDLGVALDLLEGWLVRRARTAPEPHPALRQALGWLDRPGVLDLQKLARECQMSPRRLREHFRDQIGVSAKRLVRIQRFRRALGHLADGGGPGLADVALACGYYDQSHLYRDFRGLAGMTPHAYVRALGDGLDGPDVLGG